MQFRSGLPAVLLVAIFGTGAPLAAGGAQAELLGCLEQIPTVVGTEGADVLVGTTDDDVIAGLGGDDVIAGLEGHDLICGGPGDDRITGGVGIFESDVISGDAGDDLVVVGSTASVAVYAFAPGPVSVDLEAGTATGWGVDALVGVHNVVGSRFGDVLRGSPEFNCLDGGAGDDVLVALDGDDCLYGGTGRDALDGGPGSDLIAFQHVRNPVTANLAAGFSRGEGLDRLVSIERVVGTSLADVLTGDAGPNELTGGGGADRIAGGPGADRLDGGLGRDRVDGGVGRDRCLSAERRSRCP
jgi:Ca2+-binding RTX toxin-like protein